MQVERGLTPRLATRILVNGPEWPADFLRIVWMECTGVPGALGVPANMCAMRGGCSDSEAMADVDGGEGRRERSMSKDDSDALCTVHARDYAETRCGVLLGCYGRRAQDTTRRVDSDSGAGGVDGGRKAREGRWRMAIYCPAMPCGKDRDNLWRDVTPGQAQAGCMRFRGMQGWLYARCMRLGCA